MHSTNIPVYRLPIDYGILKVTQEYRIKTEWQVTVMCYFSTTETLYMAKCRYRLAVYSVSGRDSTITLLDTLDLGDTWGGTPVSQPRVDHQSDRLYIPCSRQGVRVVRYDGSKLVPGTTLRCMKEAISLAVASPHTLYVSEGGGGSSLSGRCHPGQNHSPTAEKGDDVG